MNRALTSIISKQNTMALIKMIIKKMRLSTSMSNRLFDCEKLSSTLILGIGGGICFVLS